MMVKQCTFLDLMEEPGSLMGGIMMDNGDVICGCCGGIFEKANEGTTWKLIEEYDNWVDIDYRIRCCDDLMIDDQLTTQVVQHHKGGTING